MTPARSAEARRRRRPRPTWNHPLQGVLLRALRDAGGTLPLDELARARVHALTGELLPDDVSRAQDLVGCAMRLVELRLAHLRVEPSAGRLEFRLALGPRPQWILEVDPASRLRRSALEDPAPPAQLGEASP